MTRPRVGFALGSGSARGLAHIGVVRALTEAGVPVDCVAGSSIGSVVGAVLASGNLDRLEESYLAFDWRKVASFMDLVFPRSGIIDGDRLEEFVRQHVRENLIEDLPLPFVAVATDLDTGEGVYQDSGDLIEAVRASFSIPGMFTPVVRDGRVLVDGALVDPVPVSAVRRLGADVVVAIDLNYHRVPHWHEDDGSEDTAPLKLPGLDEVLDEEDPEEEDAGAGPGRFQAAMAAVRERLRAGKESAIFDPVRRWLEPETEPNPGLFEVLLASFNVMAAEITEARLKDDPPEVLVRPKVGQYRMLDFHRAYEIIEAGYQAGREALEEIPEGLGIL